MSQVENENFGLLIAYLIPGFLIVSAIGPHVPAIQSWLGSAQAAPTVGGFLFATIASVAAGLLASTVRWFVLDHFHAWMGLGPPEMDFAKLQANIDAFQAVVEYHYRYYQAYGNAIVALVVVTAARWPIVAPSAGIPGWAVMVTLAALMLLLFVASRDALRKYYVRLTALYSQAPEPKETSDDKRCPPSEDRHTSGQIQAAKENG